MALKIYLAGPEVFLPEARAVIAEKKLLCTRYGFEPMAPGDLVKRDGLDPFTHGMKISAANEGLMIASDAVIANLTPFRGVSADVGTVYELGFMCALGRAVWAFSNEPRDYFERVRDDYYQGELVTRADGRMAGPDGLSVENHGMGDNLMLDGGILARGGAFVRRDVPRERLYTDLGGFEECLKLAAAALL